jgi:hypothetical protein
MRCSSRMSYDSHDKIECDVQHQPGANNQKDLEVSRILKAYKGKIRVLGLKIVNFDGMIHIRIVYQDDKCDKEDDQSTTESFHDV